MACAQAVGRELAGVEDRLAGLHGDDRFDGGFDTLLRARLGHLVPPLALRVGEEIGAAGANLIGDAHVLGMVGDGDPVQRPVLFEALAVVDDDFPARGNLEEVVGGQRYPEHSRVEGVAGMDVGNAPVDAVGEFLVRVRRIIGFLCFDWLACSLARRGVLGRGEVTEAAGHQREADGRQAREGCVTQSCVSFHGCFLSFFDLFIGLFCVVFILVSLRRSLHLGNVVELPRSVEGRRLRAVDAEARTTTLCPGWS